MAPDSVQTAYQTQLLECRVRAQATVALIKKLKEEKQAIEDKSKLGLNQIRDILLAWKERTKRMIDESSIEWLTMWMQQAGRREQEKRR